MNSFSLVFLIDLFQGIKNYNLKLKFNKMTNLKFCL